MKKNCNLFIVSLLTIAGLGFVQNAWAGGSDPTAYMRATTGNPAQGLVYIAHNNNTLSAPAAPSSISNYAVEMDANYAPSGANGTENTSGYRNPGHFYVWAQPSRGSLFEKWTESKYDDSNTPFNATAHGTPSHLCPKNCSYCTNYKNGADGKPTSTGSADHYMVTPGRQQSADGKLTASWKADASAIITYPQTIGGEYAVKYEYLKIENEKLVSKSITYPVSPTSGDIQPEDIDYNGDVDHKSYKNDVITLTCSAGNFIRWEEEDASTKVRTNLTHTTSGSTKSCTYTVTANKNVNIYAIFKSADLGTIGGDKQINVSNVSTVYNYALTVPVTNIVGEGWSVNDFVVEFSNKQGPATIAQGEVSYSDGLLTIPFTYLANENGGTTVDVSVETVYGGHVDAQIVAYAEEIVAWEAQIDLSGATEPAEENRGSLADMLARANTLSGDFVLTLRSDIEITEPLSFTNSFTFNTYGKTITSSTTSAISIDKAGINVVVDDRSYTKSGKIIVSAATDDILSAVRFTERGQLTLNGGQLIVENTSTSANAKAYAIYVSNEGVFSMTAGSYGKVVAKASTNAAGVYVATSNDYVTLNGGEIEASANSNAYGVWSAGTTNITGATINVETLEGANAYGVYVNGVTSTFENTKVNVHAPTQNAYGAFVNAGQLNFNGGSIQSSCPTNAEGVHIVSGATAVVQQQTMLSAESENGSTAVGVNNFGSARLFNTTIKASANTTDAIAIVSNTEATTTIENGLYEATTNTGNAYGLHHLAGDLRVNGGLFKGIILSSGENAFGVRAIASATIKNATMLAETRNDAQTAYGFQSNVADVTVVLTNCSITGQSANANAYGIHSKAKLTATNCNLFATTQGGSNAMGFYAENGDNQLVNTNATVSSSETQAWGVNHKAGSCSINGGVFDVKAVQFSATAAASSFVYGIQNAKSMTTSITNASFTVKATNTSFSQNAYGIYASGIVNTSNTHYDVMSRISVYGVYGDGTSNLTLKDNTISSEATISTNDNANVYGLYSNKTFSVDGDKITATTSAKTAYAFNFGSGAVGNVLGGKFAATGTSSFGPLNTSGTIGKVVLKGGYYNMATNIRYYTGTGHNIFHVDQNQSEYEEGYRYVIAQQNPSPYVCYIGSTGYETLEAAMKFTVDNPTSNYTIVMTQSYTLPAGIYTLPKNASLLIPYTSSQTTVADKPTKHYTAEMIEEYLRLTIADGVNWSVDGKIEVSAKMYCANGATSYVNGAYGCMALEENSNIQLNNGAKLYAWGYVVGKGNIKAKAGSEVKEMFQAMNMLDFGSIVNYLSNYQNKKHFLCNQYYIQNIEAPVTYYYNSKLITTMYLGYQGSPYGTDEIKMVGTPTSNNDNYLFQLIDDNESAWVRKTYDASTDRQIWKVAGDVEMGSLKIVVGSAASVDSKDYILPITSSMTVDFEEGTRLAVTQSTELLPGVIVNINKSATMVINAKDSKNQNINFYVMNKKDWPYSTPTATYSPTWNKGTKPSRTVGDATINMLGGAIEVNGNFYTSKEGTNICSDNSNAGTVTYNNNAPIETTMTFPKGESETYTRDIVPANLKNGNNTYASTMGTLSNQAWIYKNDEWVLSYTNGCFEIIDNKVYAKPSEYVELKNTQTGSNGLLEGVANDDHTYTTIEDKLLICQSDCQWWEVETTATDGVFYCAKNGIYYYYNNEHSKWEEKVINVTFYLNEAQTSSKVVSVNYMGIPDQSVIATNPTKAQTAEYTYTFYGWKSSVTDNEYVWSAPLEPAENDMYYTPVFTATKRNYTITLKDANNGADVKVETPYGELPSYTPTKAPTAQYTYNFVSWSPALVAVTGPATYTANWGNTLNVYTVMFKDGEQTLQTKIDQPYGTATAFAGVLPTKEADNEFEYAFDGWVSSQDGTKYANGSTPTVSGDVIYSAHYATTPRYMISFVNYNGEVLQSAAVTQGIAPVFEGTPRRDPDRDGYFRFTGWKNNNGDFYAASAALPAAAQNETYTSQWEYVTTVFIVTFNNFDGNDGTWSNSFGEGETPSYDGATPLGKASDHPEQYYYEFMGWNPAIVPVAGPATYTAQWSEPIPVNYTITFVYDGYGNSITKEYAYGETPVYENTDPTPHKDDEGEFSYNFTGWSPAFAPVTGDATYTAQFEQVQHQYTITFVLNNGSANIEQKYYKNVTPVIADPTKASDAEWIYTFAGWDEPLSPVLYDKTYTAQWSQTGTPYNITFVDEDGSTILQATMSVPHAQKPTAPADPSKAAVGETFYNFVGWTSSVDANTYTAANLPAVGTADVTYTAKYEAIDPVALVIKDDNVKAYTDFATALNDVIDGATLKLMKDVARGNTATSFTKTMTLDLNGHTLSSTASEKFTLSTASTTIIIMDGSGTNNGKISMSVNANSTNYVFTVSNGTLNIVSGTIEGKNTNTNSSSVAVALRVTGGTVNIQGGTLTTTGSRNAYGIALTGGTTNISGGSITANISNASRNAYVVYISNNNAKVNISGGELSTSNAGGTYAYSIYRSSTNVSGTVTITGGKFKSYSSNSNRTFNSSRTVSGGYYVQTGYVSAASGKTIITLTEAHLEYANGYRYVVETAHTLTWNLDGGTITTAGTAAGTVASGTAIVAPTVEKQGYTFAGWSSEVADAMPTDDNLNYTALWNINQYEITFANIDGNGGSSKKQFDYGTMPSYEGTPTKEGDGTYKYTFVGWDKEIEIVTEATTYTAQFKAYKEVADIIAGGDEATKQIDVDVQTTATNMTIHTDGAVTVEPDATVEVTNDFIIEANTNTSGELIGADKVTVSDNVYFDYTFNTPKMRWNAIAFPWQVDATSGVQVGGKTLALGKDFDIIYYDGATRATQGPVDDCWKYVEDDGDKTLVPGRLYMILFAQAQNIVRFVKKTDAPLVNTEVNIEEYSGNSQDANWNGIANPTLYHAYLSAGVEEGQVYNNADDSYSVIEFANTNFPVGKPVFVQAAQEQSVVISKEQPANAPMRAASSTTNLRAEVEIMVNNVATDKVIVRTDEDAIDEYTIGSDLAKAGISSKVAQLWVNRYGTQLCKNTIAPLCDVAEYPLTIFAPTSGVYTLAVRSIDSDCALYLTQNGEAIADLTSEDYTLNFTKGNHSEYGLRVVIKRQPGVVTSFDEALMLQNVQKVIYREHLYLIMNGRIHDAAGQFIK